MAPSPPACSLAKNVRMSGRLSNVSAALRAVKASAGTSRAGPAPVGNPEKTWSCRSEFLFVLGSSERLLWNGPAGYGPGEVRAPCWWKVWGWLLRLPGDARSCWNRGEISFQ